MRLSDNLTIRYDSTFDPRVDWTKDNVAEKLKSETEGRDKIRIFNGAKLSVSILTNKEALFKDAEPEEDQAYEFYEILDRYYTNNEKKIGQFFETGVAGKNLILPWDVVNIN